MGAKSRTTSTKRQREAAKRDRKQRKEERRAQRAAVRADPGEEESEMGPSHIDESSIDAEPAPAGDPGPTP